MSVRQRLKSGFRRFLQRPGTTVDLSPLSAVLPAVAEREDHFTALSDEELTAAAVELREKGGDVTEPDELAELFALGREAARRGLDERPFDVQLLGALAMLSGHVTQMATGEGKTLAAALAVFGFAVRGERVHVLTVNDYLARRDAEWMEPVYSRLGLTAGWITELSTPDERREAYARDVTYVSVSEAGFDYLRDQLAVDEAEIVQQELATVLVDEADSILIDEARVPLVLAGAVADLADPTKAAAEVVRGLRPRQHYRAALDKRSVQLTEAGLARVEKALGGINLYEPEHLEELTSVNVALYAQALLVRDVDYIVRSGKVELVDEFRGRVAQRRRWPDGLQAAVEAKEGLAATAEGEVLGTLTVQSLIRLYPNACGMTATGVLVGEQLREFYSLEVAVVDSNAPCIRVDEHDRVYGTLEEKEAAMIAETIVAHGKGRPVLIGTLDVAESERIAAALGEAGIECAVLNAKNDAEEAAIIAEAGGFGAVTVSTQMAGRGVDIRLGGSSRSGREEADRDKVADLGGLYVIGSGRHDSRRVDDQLRGRSGRQGDPGGSVFYVSVEDDLIVHHGDKGIGTGVSAQPDGRLTDKSIDAAIEHAQRVSEGINFEIHRNTWRYSVVVERQRRVLAERRHALLTTDAAAELLADRSKEHYDEVKEEIGEEALARAARLISLHHVDRCWAEHLANLADVREGVHLRALGRLDPLDEFHRAAVPAFAEVLTEIDDRTVATFEDVKIDGPNWNLEDAGLVRPTATWTYLVHDNPFGSEMERFFTAAARAAMGRR
jgi:preprotein translocase subunit SecA